MLSEINNLKAELYSLIDLQRQVGAAEVAENCSEDLNQTANQNINAQAVTSNLFNNSNTNFLPNIENFFMFNDKVMLVDSEKNLWHLRKCKKYEEFASRNPGKCQSKEEILNSFLEYYQNLTKNAIQIEDNNIVNISQNSLNSNDINRNSPGLTGEHYNNYNISTKHTEEAQPNQIEEKNDSFNLSDSN